MKNRETQWISLFVLCGIPVLLTGLLVTTGCGEEEPPQQIVQDTTPPPPPPPPPPKVKSVADLMDELGIDDRVELAERDAPNTTEQRIAVLRFFDAFAKGDTAAVAAMLSPMDQEILHELRESDQWTETIDDIERIKIFTGPRPEIVGVQAPPGARLAVLGMFTVNGDYQPTMWYMGESSDGPQFDAAPTPPDIVRRMSGTDMISAWHDIIRQELARSQEPDIDPSRPQQVLSQRSDPSAPPADPDRPGPEPPSIPGPGGPGGPGSPGGPGPGTPID